MENSEEILHSLEEFAKLSPKDIPRELEEYLKFVAKSGDPIYPWSAIKYLLREKLLSVITEFYESCSTIPPCPNVEMFNYNIMKNLILEKLDTFAAAPFTLQRICELLTNPRKQYTRVDKYMRALEKNILVVSTVEPGGRRTENGEGFMNGLESDHEPVPEPANEINVESMDDSPYAQQTTYHNGTQKIEIENSMDTFSEVKASTSEEIVCVQYVSIEPVANAQNLIEKTKETDVSVTITAINVNEPQAEVILTEEPEVKATKIEPEIDGFPIIEATASIIEQLPETSTISTLSEATSTNSENDNVSPEASITSSEDNLEKDDILKLIDNSFETCEDTKCEVSTTNVLSGEEMVEFTTATGTISCDVVSSDVVTKFITEETINNEVAVVEETTKEEEKSEEPIITEDIKSADEKEESVDTKIFASAADDEKPVDIDDVNKKDDVQMEIDSTATLEVKTLEETPSNTNKEAESTEPLTENL